MSIEALVAELRRVEVEAEALGRGDESTYLFAVLDDLDHPVLHKLSATTANVVKTVDQAVADGQGLGSDPRILGVVAISEGWRHLDDDELRVAFPPHVVAALIATEIWAWSCETFRRSTRPRDLPDQLRRKVRLGICLTGDGTIIQLIRDRGAAAASTAVTSLDEEPTDFHHALHTLLSNPGETRIA